MRQVVNRIWYQYLCILDTILPIFSVDIYIYHTYNQQSIFPQLLAKNTQCQVLFRTYSIFLYPSQIVSWFIQMWIPICKTSSTTFIVFNLDSENDLLYKLAVYTFIMGQMTNLQIWSYLCIAQKNGSTNRWTLHDDTSSPSLYLHPNS